MWHLFAIHVKPQIRENLFHYLRNENIGVQVNYMPAYWHPAFGADSLPVGTFPISDAFYNSEISIPLHTELTDEQILRISFLINQRLNSYF